MSGNNDIIRNESSEALGTPTEPLEDRNETREAVGTSTDPIEDVFAATTVMSSEAIPEIAAAATETQVQVGSLLRERYLLKEEVDSGGMGVVYKALDQQLADADGESPCVAIKVLSPKLAGNKNALRALQQEATKVRCLSHPHIVRFIDFDRDGDQYFLVMEWLEGRTLASILDSADARNIDRIYALRIVRQLGDALDYAHRCGIVHADVKPGNVMILPNGNAKLFDFGIARVRQAQSAVRFDTDSLRAATPAYASMQVLTGDEPVAADDVFSLACLLYRLIAGYRVFGPRNAADASQAGMTPQRPQGFTDSQWSAMRKALSYSRVTRFAAMDDFISALDDKAAQVPSLPTPQPSVVEVPEPRSKLPFVVALLLLVAAVGGALSDQGRSWLLSFRQVGERVPDVTAPAEDVEVSGPEMISSRPEPAVESTKASAIQSGDVRDEARPEPAAATVPSSAEVPATSVAAVVPEPVNTIGFAANEVQVRESDSAVQIDILRSGSIQLPLTIGYSITGITATEGVDYFTPSNNVISFAAGEDVVRLLIPLVQDFAIEGDEHFLLRLGETAGISGTAGLQTTMVTIRDDEPQTR